MTHTPPPQSVASPSPAAAAALPGRSDREPPFSVHPPGTWGLQLLAKVSGYHKNNSGPTPGRRAGQVQEGKGEKEKTRRRKADIGVCVEEELGFTKCTLNCNIPSCLPTHTHFPSHFFSFSLPFFLSTEHLPCVKY